MSVLRLDAKTIVLEGACPIEDAELLVRQLLATPAAIVDWRRCETAHTAVIQVLMAAGVALKGPPCGEALARWVRF